MQLHDIDIDPDLQRGQAAMAFSTFAPIVSEFLDLIVAQHFYAQRQFVPTGLCPTFSGVNKSEGHL
jgi:hypothetical protein